jgi:general secretion pathway protein H
MLVVLMVMGLFVGLVTVVLRPDERAALRLEAERLSELLDLAAEEARLGGRGIAWTANSSAYRFWRAADDASWNEIRDSDLLRARALPQGVTISAFRVENNRPQGGMRLEFPPQGASLAFTINLSLGEHRYAVEGSPIGELRVLPGEGRLSAEPATR